jgi:hypothetical protein
MYSFPIVKVGIAITSRKDAGIHELIRLEALADHPIKQEEHVVSPTVQGTRSDDEVPREFIPSFHRREEAERVVHAPAESIHPQDEVGDEDGALIGGFMGDEMESEVTEREGGRGGAVPEEGDVRGEEASHSAGKQTSGPKVLLRRRRAMAGARSSESFIFAADEANKKKEEEKKRKKKREVFR